MSVVWPPLTTLAGFHHGFLIAFEDLQEAAILVEKYSRNANLSIGFAGLFQHGLKFSLGEEMRGGACANYMKHLFPGSWKSLVEKYGLRSNVALTRFEYSQATDTTLTAPVAGDASIAKTCRVN